MSQQQSETPENPDAEAISVMTGGLALASHFGNGQLTPADLAAGMIGGTRPGWPLTPRSGSREARTSAWHGGRIPGLTAGHTRSWRTWRQRPEIRRFAVPARAGRCPANTSSGCCYIWSMPPPTRAPWPPPTRAPWPPASRSDPGRWRPGFAAVTPRRAAAPPPRTGSQSPGAPPPRTALRVPGGRRNERHASLLAPRNSPAGCRIWSGRGWPACRASARPSGPWASRRSCATRSAGRAPPRTSSLRMNASATAGTCWARAPTGSAAPTCVGSGSGANAAALLLDFAPKEGFEPLLASAEERLVRLPSPTADRPRPVPSGPHWASLCEAALLGTPRQPVPDVPDGTDPSSFLLGAAVAEAVRVRTATASTPATEPRQAAPPEDQDIPVCPPEVIHLLTRGLPPGRHSTDRVHYWVNAVVPHGLRVGHGQLPVLLDQLAGIASWPHGTSVLLGAHGRWLLQHGPRRWQMAGHESPQLSTIRLAGSVACSDVNPGSDPLSP